MTVGPYGPDEVRTIKGRVRVKTSIGVLLLLLTVAACSSVSASSSRIVARASGPATPRTSTTHPTHHPSSKPTHPKPSSGPIASRLPVAERNIPRADLPRHALTPGVALAVGRARVCTPGYASATRDVSEAEKAAVYNRYGVVWIPYKHEVDHLISLELGGSNAIRNLWPEPYAGRWGARTKDVLENRLHDLVCEGKITLRSAQRQEGRDWVAAYRRYVGSPTSGNGSAAPAAPSSAGGFYASRYPTASTIYCADDPAWHGLSPTYLVHFATFAQAKARFPSYHLHQPC
jgi:hypothetical protein